MWIVIWQSRLRLNVELMRRQLHALRDAAAIAFALNRTLVLPHFDCVCDRSELVDYIPSCVFPGAPPEVRPPRALEQPCLRTPPSFFFWPPAALRGQRSRGLL